MATTAAEILSDYPVPVYRYTVSFGGEDIAFSEVSGLDFEYETITYKDGLGFKYMPGQTTPINISMKKGIVRTKSEFFIWINSISMNTVDKKDMVISLTNETADSPIIVWTVTNAFPTKLAAPSFDASSNEIAIETLDMMCDSLSVGYDGSPTPVTPI